MFFGGILVRKSNEVAHVKSFVQESTAQLRNTLLELGLVLEHTDSLGL